MKERVGYLDFAKGISIILVVYGHAAAQYRAFPVWDQYFALSSTVIFSYVMPFFFMLSGSFQRRKVDADSFNIRTYLINTTRSLLVPFYTLSIAFLVLNVLLSKFTDSPSIPQMIRALLIEQSNSMLLPSGVLWFLFTLYLLQIATVVCAKQFRMKLYCLIMLALLLRTELNVFSHCHLFAFDRFSAFYIFYILGYCFSDIITKSVPHSGKGLLFLLAGCSTLLWLNNGATQNAIVCFLSQIASLLGVTSVLLSLLVLGVSFRLTAKLQDNTVIKAVSYVGASSILLYVFHMPTFTIFKKISSLLVGYPNYFSVMILFVPGVVFPLLYGRALSLNSFVYTSLMGRLPRRGRGKV